MMRWICFALYCALTTAVWGQQLRVSIAPERVYLGDVMVMQVEADGVELRSVNYQFSKPVQHVGEMTSTQIVNGRVSMQKGVRVVPLEEGAYRLESLQARTASGEVLTYDQHPTVEVQALVANPNYQLTTTLEPSTPFPGDEVKLFLTLRAPAVSVDGGKVTPFIERSFFGNIQERLPNIDFASPTTEDTPLRQTGNAQWLPRRTEGNVLIWTIVIPYRAVRSGEQHFPAPRLNDQIVSSIRDGQVYQERVMAMGTPLVVEVLSPPLEGRPKEFTGAIGTTFDATLELSAHNVNVGDPVQLILTVTSDGDETLLRAPTLPSLDGFRMYGDPTRKAIPGGCQFIYNIRPLRAGLLEVPAMSFAYFNRDAQAYQSLSTTAIPLYARASAQLMLLDEEGGLTRASLPPALQLTRTTPAEIMPRLWVWLLLCGSMTLFLLRLLFKPLRVLFTKLMLPFLRRRPTAHAVAQLAHAKTPAAAASILRVWAGRPALTAQELRNLLPASADAEVILRAYSALETAMYTGEENVASVIEELRRALPKVPRPQGYSRGRFTLLLLCVLLPTIAQADSFIREQAEAMTIAATQPSEYATATQLWLQVIDSGETQREVYLNGVTCALFSNHVYLARQLLTRYEILYGCDTSSERAASAIAEALQEPPHWTRTVFAPHYTIAFNVRLEGLCILVAVALLFWSIPLRWLRPIRACVLLAIVAVAVSVLISWTQLNATLPTTLSGTEVQQ